LGAHLKSVKGRGTSVIEQPVVRIRASASKPIRNCDDDAENGPSQMPLPEPCAERIAERRSLLSKGRIPIIADKTAGGGAYLGDAFGPMERLV
jgi:hypothetical protein